MFRLFRQTTGSNRLPRIAYRLRRQPDLVFGLRTAGVMRAITRMQFGPVSREWFTRTSNLSAMDAESLLLALVVQGAVEEIDLSKITAYEEVA